MAELPKDSARTVTGEVTPAVEELLERYASRTPKLALVTETDPPIALDYVTTSAQARLATLRRVLDETDPKSALVFVRDGGGGEQSTPFLRHSDTGGRCANSRRPDPAREPTSRAVRSAVVARGVESGVR